MTLKDFLRALYCWEGKIKVNNTHMIEIFELDIAYRNPASIKIKWMDETINYYDFSVYLDYCILGITPCYNSETSEVYIEVIMTEK